MIERRRHSFSIQLMCRCMNVSTSGYYDWRHRPMSDQEKANSHLLDKIRTVHEQSDQVFGSPRIHDELLEQDESCGKHRVTRLMRQAGLSGIPQRKRWQTKASGERPVEITNHLQRNFNARQANDKWASDITFIRTAQHWLYLAVVMDLYS